jgi:PhoPQ-activated pathogenicity-related protein
MLHESIKQTAFTIKERTDYRLRVTKHKVIAPADTYSLDFIQESLEDGKVKSSQTYNFFMTNDDLKVLCEGLLSE